MNPGSVDDLLPASAARDRLARRRDRQRRRWVIAGGVAAIVVVVVVMVVVFGGDDDSPRSRTRAADRASTTSSRAARTTTTSLGDLGTTTSTLPDDGTAPDPDSPLASAPPTPGPPDTSPPVVDPGTGVTVTEDGGACTFDASLEELVDSGTIQNSGPEEVVVEVQVTWFDDTGELDSWSDLQGVASGDTVAWSVATAWPDPIQGTLRCEIAQL